MRQLKLVVVKNEASDVGPVDALGADDTTARLLADLERAWDGADRELGNRAAKCIRELVRQKEQATALLIESSALLKDANERLAQLRTMI